MFWIYEKWFWNSEKWFESLKKCVVSLKKFCQDIVQCFATHFQGFNFIWNTVSEYDFWQFSPCILFCVSYLKPCKLLTYNKGFKTLKIILNLWKYFLRDWIVVLNLLINVLKPWIKVLYLKKFCQDIVQCFTNTVSEYVFWHSEYVFWHYSTCILFWVSCLKPCKWWSFLKLVTLLLKDWKSFQGLNFHTPSNALPRHTARARASEALKPRWVWRTVVQAKDFVSKGGGRARGERRRDQRRPVQSHFVCAGGGWDRQRSANDRSSRVIGRLLSQWESQNDVMTSCRQHRKPCAQSS